MAFPAAAAKPPPLDDAPKAGPNTAQGGAATGSGSGTVSGSGSGPTAPQGGLPRNPARAAATGSGFIVAAGAVMTNAHVVRFCTRMTARNAAGQTVEARLRAADTRRDLAILVVPADFGPPLAFRESPPVQLGESVITYGFPLSGLLSSGPSLTTGSISALSGLRDNPAQFQISAPVQPGNSGGPLLDAQGNVAGIVTSKLNAAEVAKITGGDIPQNVNFAIKASEALAFLDEQGLRPWRGASGGPERRASEIGQIANPSTVFLSCFR